MQPITDLLKMVNLWDKDITPQTARLIGAYCERPWQNRAYVNLDEACTYAVAHDLGDPYPFMLMLEGAGELDLPEDMGKLRDIVLTLPK